MKSYERMYNALVFEREKKTTLKNIQKDRRVCQKEECIRRMDFATRRLPLTLLG